MKKIFDGIGSLVLLFVVGAIIFGALKEGYAVQVILVVGIIVFFIYQSVLKDEREEKQRKEAHEKEKRAKFEMEIGKVEDQMYSFAYKNERISLVTYDIEEGGEYLTEYDEYGTEQINKIIETVILYPTEILQKHISKIQEEILKFPKVQTKRKYVGFDY